jgi:hypothetical protein
MPAGETSQNRACRRGYALGRRQARTGLRLSFEDRHDGATRGDEGGGMLFRLPPCE